MKLRLSWVGLILLWVLPIVYNRAQSVEPTLAISGAGTARFEVARRDPLIGEPVDAALVVELSPGISVVEWPALPAVWGDFTFSGLSEVETIVRPDGTGLYRQTFTLHVWRAGVVTLPELRMPFQVANDDRVLELLVGAPSFTVPSVLAADDLELRPFKPQIGFFYIPLWLFLAIGAALYGIGYVVWRRWQLQRISRLAALSDRETVDSVLEKLRQLSREGLSSAAIYEAVSVLLRMYLRTRFDLPAPEMTTLELIQWLEADSYFSVLLTESRRSELWRMLEQADFVKFAQAVPEASYAVRLLNVAERWIMAVEQAVRDAAQAQEFA